MWTEITRLKYARDGLRYASDLTDAEWRWLSPHMPPPNRLGRPRRTDLREVVNASSTSFAAVPHGGCCPSAFRPMAPYERC